MGQELLKTITEYGIEGLGRFYSVYRGMVVNNEDPSHTNRLKVMVPGIQGGVVLWALPKSQHGSFGIDLEGVNHGNGFKYLTPRNGDMVWISFELGDPSSPVWEYYGWSQQQIPPELDDNDTFGFVTPNGNKVIFSESTNGMDIYLYGEASIYSKKSINLMAEESVNLIAGNDRNAKVIANNNSISVSFGESTIVLDSDGVNVNGGNNDGSVNIKDLVNKLNNLVNELESLRNTFNIHTHVGVHGPTAPTTTQVASPFSQFNKQDFEDTKFLH